MIQRPRHLQARQAEGQMWGEDMVLIRSTGQRVNGKWEANDETETSIRGSAEPVRGESRIRKLEEDGIRIENALMFYTTTTLRSWTPNETGDIILYRGERYRIREVKRWRSQNVAMGIRQEGQTGQ